MGEMASLVNNFPYLGIFLLLLLGDLGLPFPEDTTLILSGFLISQKVVKPFPVFLVIYPTLLLTDFFLYSVGKKYGRNVIGHRRFRKFVSPQGLSKFEERFRKRGIFVVFVGRHILGLRAQVFLAAGVVGMPAVKFLVADGVSAILTIALMMGMGYLGGNSIQMLKQDVTKIQHILIVLVMILVTVGIIFMYFKNRTRFKKT